MDAVELLGRCFIDNLCWLAKILKQASLPSAVIGASAFMLHGIDLGRTTRDLDLAVAIEGGHKAIRTLLLNAGLASTSIEHRFKMPDETEIDVLAMDPTWTPEREIRLPDGNRIQCVGLPESVQQSVEMEFDTCRVPVAPLCLLIAIKLHTAAANDRPHDLKDACAAMETYEKAGLRRFDIDYEQFEGLRFETAGAFLAGLDTAKMVSTQTKELIDHAINSLLEKAQLTKRFAGGEARRELIIAYQKGLDAAPD